MFQSLQPLPPDAIIGIMALFREDDDPRKVDLSVGVYQDLTNINLSYGVYEISSPTSSFSRTATLRTGGGLVNNNGLEWNDFSFADLVSKPGMEPGGLRGA